MGRVTVVGGARATNPFAGILLKDIVEGQIVKINENGTPTEFYVAKHDYESTLNGTGRTLVVRKDCYDSRQWNTSNVNAYASSTIDTWLNNTYKNLLDSVAQGLIGTTKFYFTPGNGNFTVATLERSTFLLSVTELGKTLGAAKVEGTALNIAAALQVSYLNGVVIEQWTRSPNISSNRDAFYFQTNGEPIGGLCNRTLGSRPCFTLPENAIFDKTTIILKGVA